MDKIIQEIATDLMNGKETAATKLYRQTHNCTTCIAGIKDADGPANKIRCGMGSEEEPEYNEESHWCIMHHEKKSKQTE